MRQRHQQTLMTALRFWRSPPLEEVWTKEGCQVEMLELAAIPMSEGETAAVEMTMAAEGLLAPDLACTRIHSKTCDSPDCRCHMRRIACLWPMDEVQAHASDGCLEKV